MIVSLCCILCNSLALIINRCRKLSFQIRFVSKNLLASFLIFESSIVLHTLTMLLVGDVYYKQIFDSRIFFEVFWYQHYGDLCVLSLLKDY